MQRELDLRVAHPDDYGYVAFVLQHGPMPGGQPGALPRTL